MCLIVVKNDPKASFSVEDFKSSFSRNSDGTGIIYVEDGRIKTEKTMGNLKESLAMYYKHMHRPQFILHHRFATQGEKSITNVHPFKVLSLDEGDPYDLYFAHNGNIPMSKFDNTVDKKFSDTYLFALEYMTPLMKKYPDIIEQKVFQYMLHDFIGGGNKLAFLRSDGKSWIFNKSAGKEHHGCWISNAYSVENYRNTHNYAKKHGTSNHHNSTYYNDGYDDYDYEDGVWWRDNYNSANNMKKKAAETLTSLSIDDLLSAIDEYSGMPVDTLKELFKTDCHLVYDMTNLLSDKPVTQALLNEDAEKVANTLYDLLLGYAKQKAA